MLTPELLYSILDKVLHEARLRWKEAWVTRIKIGSGKIFVYMIVGENATNVKVIIYRSKVKVRVYTKLKGLAIALQRIFEREYERALRMREHEREESI